MRCGTWRVTLVLYRRRAFTSVVARKAVLRRAFDKAVRRKPLAFAADAGLWEFNAGQKPFRIVPGCELRRRVEDHGWRSKEPWLSVEWKPAG
jgi:hypothetical protein